jgi:type II secretory pathway predicted ATPase ExeA
VRGIHGAVAMALGQAPRFHHATLIPQVEAALAAEADERNRHVILAIDEAHLLTGEQLEAVRMMTSHGLDSGSPLTVLLIGQPTLRRRLRVGDMAALDQRVQLRCTIPAPALTAAEAEGYIRRHLEHAGRSDTLFSDDAVRHEAPSDRAEVKGLRRLAVAAAGLKLRAA